MRIPASLLLILSAVFILFGIWVNNSVLFWLGLIIMILFIALLVFVVLAAGIAAGLLKWLKNRLERDEIKIEVKKKEK